MALSKSNRIIILLVIDSIFFLIELISGYAVHSLALVADSFHMLNDVLSLCVGLWAVKVANQRGSSKKYTYGWQRAETLGALVNGVFLVALCVTIFLEAIQRFVEPQKVSNPKLVLIVGCLGLASNLLGLVLFHDHSHSHGGGGGHSHGDEETALIDSEHDHAGHSHSHEQPEASASSSNGTALAQKASSNSRQSRAGRKHSRSLSRAYLPGFDEIPTSPHAIRNSVVYRSSVPRPDSDVDDEEQRAGEGNHEGDIESHAPADQSTSLLNGSHGVGYGAVAGGKPVDHTEHHHAQPKSDGKGHSHSDLNMRGIFLHVMGDALGNIGVIATALIIWLTKYSWRYYFDPAISLVITCIILASAIPLCKAASRILLQAVPDDIDVEEISADILSLPDVIGVHHLHVWQLSDTKKVASLHVQVAFDFKGQGSARYMRLAQEINNCLHAYGIHSSTIQPEFCLDPDHDHKAQDGDAANESENATTSAGKPGSRLPSKPGSLAERQCLLGCADPSCSGKSCCPPPDSRDEDEGGHGHGHSH
ncbi:cation efflux protein [Neohortaea acidophila]|uniref:Cation efflux protein n=1 Tax=Neohortaea acidophila TaxID=245834 RepID=A0A6A6PS37_9PEZI|nr:cation efflux protein [Neohortaea acidophila]KAF2482596.1 cation efflux protein [Neohortaea acidophila]